MVRFTLSIGFLAVLVAAATPLAAGASPGEQANETSDLLAAYNATIEAAMTRIESLQVRQEIVEPCEGGPHRTATALLVYERGRGLTRTLVESNLRYPSGKYRLESLVGPRINPQEYRVTVVGREYMEGETCLRIDVEALERDVDHFDGSIWISLMDSGPVRVAGSVADPPFPAREILLDKSFEVVGEGLRLVRRHTGEVEVGALLGGQRGVRHIFYENYIVVAAPAR